MTSADNRHNLIFAIANMRRGEHDLHESLIMPTHHICVIITNAQTGML